MSDRKAELEKRKKQLEDLKKKRSELKSNDLNSANESLDSTPIIDDSLTKILKDIEAKSFKHASTTYANNKMTYSKDINFLNKKDLSNLNRSLLSSPVKYSVSRLTSAAIVPKEKIIYSKYTMTVENGSKSVAISTQRENQPTNKQSIDHSNNELVVDNAKNTNLSENSIAENANQLSSVDLNLDTQVVKLSEEQANQVFEKKRFIDFFKSATKLIERAMLKETDICFDYSYNYRNKVHQKSDPKNLNIYRKFTNNFQSQNRTVTCLDWSTLHPDLVLSSYTPNSNKMSDEQFYRNNDSEAVNIGADGIVNIWNIRFASEQNTPEYTFLIQSPVTTCCFSPFHQNLVIGGTHSGMIAIWDNRSSKRMPVQRSNLSTKSHTFPVCASKIIGINSSNNLITLSSDGRICTWTLDMLSCPAETLDLFHKKSRSIMSSCISFASGETNNCIVGCEEGSIYTVQRVGNKSGINSTYDAHFGPVTSVNYNPYTDNKNVKNLFLSSSMDWSIKLWSNKLQDPIYVFDDYNDFVSDAQWAPLNPHVFACADGTGKMDIWNLSESFEEPIASFTDENTIVNKLCWSPNGRFLAAGDLDGHISVLPTENFAHTTNDTIDNFSQTIEELKSKVSQKNTKHSNRSETPTNIRFTSLPTTPATPTRPYMKI